MIHSFRLSAAPVNVPLQLLMTVICQPFTIVPDNLVGGALFCIFIVVLGWQACPGAVTIKICPTNLLLYYVCNA